MSASVIKSEKFHRVIARALSVLLIPALSNCNAMPGLSGAASMQVEVEVYKGPLSFQPEVRLGEFIGTIVTARGRLRGIKYALEPDAEEGSCLDDDKESDTSQNNGTSYEQAKQPSDKAVKEEVSKEVNKKPDTLKRVATTDTGDAKLKISLLKSLCEADKALTILYTRSCAGSFYGTKATKQCATFDISNKNIAALSNRMASDQPNEIEKLARAAANASGVLRTTASYWSSSLLGHMSKNPQIRTLIIDFAGFSAEISNTLKSRADALLKLQSTEDADELSLASHLRDSPTAYIQLYNWFYASGDRIENEGNDYSPDRVRAIESLFNDDVWASINTAYASGAGDVGMAFIKDDIGNWNLKKFDNDPSKLLDAYKSVGQAALGAALQITTGGASAVAKAGTMVQRSRGATEALGIADRVAFGGGAEAGPVKDNPTLKRFHARTTERLAELKKEMTAQAADITTQIADIKNNKLGPAKAAVAAAEADIKKLNDSRPTNSSAASSRQLASDKRAQAILAANEAETGKKRINVINDNLLKLRAGVPAEAEQIRTLEQEKTQLSASIPVWEGRAKNLAKEADDADALAGRHEKIDADIRNIQDGELAKKKAELADLEQKLKAAEARQDGGLHKDMVDQAKQIIDDHSRFIDEIEMLQVSPALQTTSQPVAAAALPGAAQIAAVGPGTGLARAEPSAVAMATPNSPSPVRIAEAATGEFDAPAPRASPSMAVNRLP